MIPKTMNVVVTTGHGGLEKLEYRGVEVPAPVADDENQTGTNPFYE